MDEVYHGRHVWEQLHGKRLKPVSKPLRLLGWRWQPMACNHEPPHYLDTGERTRKGLS